MRRESLRAGGRAHPPDIDPSPRAASSPASLDLESAGRGCVPSWAYALVTLASMLLGATSIVRGTSALASISESDLSNFFLKSAEYVLRGDPWQLYSVRHVPLITYPNDGTPLSVFLMAPPLALARSLGLADDYKQQIIAVSLPFVLLAPLLGYLALRALRLLDPDLPDAPRLLAFSLVTLSPLLWLSYSPWGHLEQPLMLCFLVATMNALQARREVMAGVLAALAVLSGVIALFPLLGAGVLLLAHRQWRAFLKVGGIGGVLAVLAMAPFFLLDRADAVYSFVTWRGRAQIGANSLWVLFDLDSPSGGSVRRIVAAVVRRLDVPSMLPLIALVAFLASRRLRISAYSPEAWGVMGIGALALPALTKLNWPYYYLQPFVLLLIWEFGTMRDRRSELWRWPVLTIGFLLVAATFSDYIGLKSMGAIDRIAVGVSQSAAMLSFAFATWRRLHARPPETGATPG